MTPLGIGEIMQHLTFEHPEETAGVQVHDKGTTLDGIFDDLQHACEHTQDILNGDISDPRVEAFAAALNMVTAVSKVGAQ